MIKGIMKNAAFLMLFWMQTTGLVAKELAQLYSPDRHIRAEILEHEKLYYQVAYDGSYLMQATPLSVTISRQQRKYGHATGNTLVDSKDTTLTTGWATGKYETDQYSSLNIKLDNELSDQFRAYNNGVAYCCVLHTAGKEYIVNHVELSYRFNFNTDAWMLNGASYESNYIKRPLDVQSLTNFRNANSKIYLPMVVQVAPTIKRALTEAGLYNYPSLFHDREHDYENFLNGTFEKYSTANKTSGLCNYAEVSTANENSIAKLSNQFQFPWRILVIAPGDAVLAECDFVYQLSKPSAITQTDWVKPGKVAWDWWHEYVGKGKEFKGGVNTDTYLPYIDFATKHALEYIIVDWLWTDKYDITLFNPEVDIKRIISYGKQKRVGVILWCPGHTLYKQPDKALDLLSSLGVAGIKADFLRREDQTGITLYEHIAAAAATRKLLVDFHGCTKPTGLSRTWPNVINYDAVLGNEYTKLQAKCTVDHKVMLAFTCALQSSMDYTPGGMRNSQQGNYGVFFNQPLIMDNRSNEMALYVLYNKPLKMLYDAPSAYEQKPEVLHFISDIPTTWDETKILQASLGE